MIADDDELAEYLGNAGKTLRPGGIFFGSTLGREDGDAREPEDIGAIRVMEKSAIVRSIVAVGFAGPKLVKKPHEAHHPDDKCVFEFCTKKPGKTGYSGAATTFRYAPSGTAISNRAPFPGMPVSRIEIPVIARISRTRNNPYPV